MTIQEKVIADMQLVIDRQSELIRQERLRNRELEDQIRQMRTTQSKRDHAKYTIAGLVAELDLCRKLCDALRADNLRLRDEDQGYSKPLPKVEV